MKTTGHIYFALVKVIDWQMLEWKNLQVTD